MPQTRAIKEISPLLLACLMISACSTLSYKEPSAGERARVRFASQTEHVVVVRGYDDKACAANEQEWMRLRAGYLANSNSKRLGMPLWRFHDNGAKEVYVDATRPFHGLIGSADREIQAFTTIIHSCAVAVTFDFKPGVDYEVEYLWDRQTCSVNISQILNDTGKPTLKHLATIGNRVNGDNAQCLDAFKKRRLY
jgi:hypothetical protein